MKRTYQRPGTIAAGMTALSLGLALLGTAPAEASLVGDDVELDIEFSSESSLDFDSDTFVDGNTGEGTAMVEENGSFIHDTFAEGPPEFFAEGFAEGEFSEGSISSFARFNLEDEFIEGDFGTDWLLFNESVAPFSWEYTFSDLDWVDFPSGKIIGLDLTFAEGSGGISGPNFGAGIDADPADFLSTSFTDNSVTVGFNLDFFGDNIPDFSEGFFNADFKLDLIVDHKEEPVGVPEPLGLGALVALGTLGMGAKLKQALSARK